MDLWFWSTTTITENHSGHLFGGLAGKDPSGYALALFPGASYTTGWDATLFRTLVEPVRQNDVSLVPEKQDTYPFWLEFE
jgi:hypothetical protein